MMLIKCQEYSILYKKINLFIIICFIFLPLLFISDGLTKYFFINGNIDARVSLAARTLFELIILIYIIKKMNRLYLQYFLLFAFFTIIFIIGQIMGSNIENYKENLITLNKYIYLFLVFIFFRELLYDAGKSNKIFKLLNFLFLTNITCIFLGLFFNINYFETFYHMDYRYGYNGVFFAGNASSYILISMVAFYYFRVYYEHLNKIYLLLAVIASSLSGMKAVYIFLLLLFFFHLSQKISKKALIIGFPIFLFLLNYFLNYIQSSEFQALISFFIRVAEEKGFFYMITGGRPDFIASKFLIVVNDWTFLNFIFGGTDTYKYIMEMDLFDLFLFFGGFGSLLYAYLFYKTFMAKIIGHKFFLFYIVSMLILAFFGGHFLNSPTTSIYFVLVVLYFRIYRNKKI